MKTKRFDCVAMMHKGARRIYAATKGMSRAEELDYWRAKAGELFPRAPTRVEGTISVREPGSTYVKDGDSSRTKSGRHGGRPSIICAKRRLRRVTLG